MRRLCIACLCLAVVSCGGGDRYGEHPPYPCAGKVLVNGQPAKGAHVIFYPVEDWGQKDIQKRSIVPQATVDDQGRFVLSTYGSNDGAPAGSYKVVITWGGGGRGRKAKPDKLGGKYAKQSVTKLTAKVEAANNELPPFDLKVDKLVE